MNPNNKKNIIRKCEGCKELKDRDSLLKVTRSDSRLYINPSSKTLGRSMYVCKSLTCVKNVIKKKRIANALKYKNYEEIIKTEAELLNLVNVSNV